ncbi:RNA polymerase sigma factor [Fulvitalea axinellae]|uniref:RNA polymerase sigma factor n=1 Tax=Fulvitalea axinellae TaxID=1182444 RepID=A0AAU9CSJ5_9BACT|nr:RNA polymerase sigma factor [Fulvitalea axinellae]
MPEEDIDIIKRVVDGETSLFANLVDRHKDYVYRIAYKILQNNEDAEEVAQDAFMKAFKNLETFRGDSAFGTWIYRIVYNSALSKLKRRKKHSADTGLEDTFFVAEDDAKQLTSDRERRVFIGKALEALPPEEKVFVDMFYLKEMTLKEIGDATGEDTNFIKVKIHRSRTKLRNILSGLLNGEAKSLL